MLTTAEDFSFSNIKGEHLGHNQTVRAYISGESNTKATFVRYDAECVVCGATATIDLSTDPQALLKKFLHADIVVNPPNVSLCDNGGAHKWALKEKDPPLTYQEIYVRDGLENNEEGKRSSNRDYHGYITGSAPDYKEVKLEGIPLINSKTDNIEFIVNHAEAAESSVDGFQVPPEDLPKLKEYFGKRATLDEYLDFAKKNNPRIAGHEMAKLGVLLTYLSPIWIEVNGQRKAGTIRTMLLGDPRTGKGSIEDYLRLHVRMGKHAIGETSSRTGITYTIDTERGIIIWGVMVEADRGLVVIEALHKFPAEDLATMRETLVKQYVEVRRSFSSKAWARTRIVADSNGRQEMHLYPWACMAIRNLECFKDQVDITRWDMYFPFWSGEVDSNSITDAMLEGKDDPDFLLNIKELIMWAWSRLTSDITFSGEALGEARVKYSELLREFSLPDIPLIHEDSFYSLLRIATAFAILSFSTKDGIVVSVEACHIDLAAQFLRNMMEALGVSDYKTVIGEKKLDEDDYEKFVEAMSSSEVLSQAINELVKGQKNSTELANLTQRNAGWIREQLSPLERTGLLAKASKGYRLTAIGIEAWRKYQRAKTDTLYAENRHLGDLFHDAKTDKPDRTDSKNTPPSPTENSGQKQAQNYQDGGGPKPVGFVGSVGFDAMKQNPTPPQNGKTGVGYNILSNSLILELTKRGGKTYVKCKDHMTDADGKERWFCKDDGEWEVHLQRQHSAEPKEVDVGSSQAEIALDIFRKLCGPDNKGATEAEALAELKKAGIEEPEGAKLIESLQRNGQIYESSPGRFSVTKS